MTYDSIIIGAGPAGMVAALQMKRSGLDIVLFEKGEIGGLLRNANCVENYLGFPDGISGKELIRSFQDHLCKHKISIIREEVVEIGKEDAVFSVRTVEHMPVVRISLGAGQLEVQCASQCFQADYVLVAVGREPRYPRIATKSRRGLYYAGDVRSGQYRQVHIATGDALRVAMEITHSHSYSL